MDRSGATAPGTATGYPGETIGLSIGQGPINTTPLQLARMAATLATGFRITPHLVEAVENATGREIEMAPRNQPVDVNLSPYYRAAVLGGMRAAAHPVTGTARRPANPAYDFGGKTGTAQVASAAAAGPEADRPEELRNHAWFVGIAPIDAPEIAIVVFIEHGGSGGIAAAPLAGVLMTTYFESREAAQR